MSLLGDKLKYHIEESGLTVYMLSKLSGVNRTSIVRTLSSNRLPERENIEKLLPYLRLTPSEKEEIIQSYEIMSCGENVYYRREYVLKIITTLFSTTVHDTNARLEGILGSKSSVQINSLDAGCYCMNKNESLRLLSMLLRSVKDLDEICIFSPFNNDYIQNVLAMASSITTPDMHIRHLVHFVKNPDIDGNINYNLNILSNILPYAFSDQLDYSAGYLYISHPISVDSMVPFPFYLLFGKYTVLLSADFENSFFTSSANITGYHRAEFEKTWLLSDMLLNSDTSLDAFIERYKNVSSPRARRFTIDIQPPLFDLKDISLLEKYAADDSLAFQEYMEILEKKIKIQQDDIQPVMLFSKEGLDYFANEGLVSTIPYKYTCPIDITDRIFLLEKLKMACMHDKKIIRMINPARIPISRNTLFSVEKDKRLILVNRDTSAKIYKQIFINEPTLVSAVTDFFEYVLKHPVVYSDLIYSKDTTISVIDEYISHLCDLNTQDT